MIEYTGISLAVSLTQDNGKCLGQLSFCGKEKLSSSLLFNLNFPNHEMFNPDEYNHHRMQIQNGLQTPGSPWMDKYSLQYVQIW